MHQTRTKCGPGVAAFPASTLWAEFLEKEKCYSVRYPRIEIVKLFLSCFPERVRENVTYHGPTVSPRPAFPRAGPQDLLIEGWVEADWRLLVWPPDRGGL